MDKDFSDFLSFFFLCVFHFKWEFPLYYFKKFLLFGGVMKDPLKAFFPLLELSSLVPQLWAWPSAWLPLSHSQFYWLDIFHMVVILDDYVRICAKILQAHKDHSVYACFVVINHASLHRVDCAHTGDQ